MDPQNYQSLQEAYFGVYECEEIDEATKRTEYLQKKFDTENQNKSGSAHTYIPGKQNTGQALFRARESDRQMRGESVDLYDIILSHLLDEGYADSVENAEVIMVNMSEEWKDEILEAIDPEDINWRFKMEKLAKKYGSPKTSKDERTQIMTHLNQAMGHGTAQRKPTRQNYEIR
jgi:hypothetical protein